MSETVIADDLRIKGEVETEGDVELKGSLEGDIICRTLLISEEAKLKGSATAERVMIRGTVDGSIHGLKVTLASSARVQGELFCKSLSVDEDAFFDGTTQRVEDPLKDVRQKQKAANGKTEKAGETKIRPMPQAQSPASH